jgi:hypothetical protein
MSPARKRIFLPGKGVTTGYPIALQSRSRRIPRPPLRVEVFRVILNT